MPSSNLPTWVRKDDRRARTLKTSRLSPPMVVWLRCALCFIRGVPSLVCARRLEDGGGPIGSENWSWPIHSHRPRRSFDPDFGTRWGAEHGRRRQMRAAAHPPWQAKLGHQGDWRWLRYRDVLGHLPNLGSLAHGAGTIHYDTWTCNCETRPQSIIIRVPGSYRAYLICSSRQDSSSSPSRCQGLASQ